jgi:hypothetical protein
LTVTVALTAPGTVGVKPIPTEHLPFGPTEPSQLVEAENSFDPATVSPAKVTAVPVFFFALLVKITTCFFLSPTLTVPKFTELRDIETTADTSGAGVAVELGVGVSVGVGVGVGVDVGVSTL